ncbi:MAG: MBL fold metallo-hydrolase [Chloroflexi bacterium]|nr:MBL fold metallo-hydrolase [Chloroflexota bacterium]
MPNGKQLTAQIREMPVIPNSLPLWGLGQMGLIVKGPDALAAIDPYLSDSIREMTQEQFGGLMSRAFPPPLLPDELAADVYLITHEHPDHLDGPTLAAARPDARFVAPGWCMEALTGLGIRRERITVPEVLTPFTLPGTSLRLTAVPAAHYDKEYDARKGYRWLGYLIEWNGVVLYHAGDTVLYPGYMETMRDLPTPDVALLPVNGRDYFRESVLNITGTLLPAEAALLARELGWGVIIPGHNDLFTANSIPNAQIVDALERLAPRQAFKLLQPGELYYFVK